MKRSGSGTAVHAELGGEQRLVDRGRRSARPRRTPSREPPRGLRRCPSARRTRSRRSSARRSFAARRAVSTMRMRSHQVRPQRVQITDEPADARRCGSSSSTSRSMRLDEQLDAAARLRRPAGCQFSLENANSVSASTPRRAQPSTMSRDRLDAGAMSEMAWQGTTRGPASVAVHDDGDVARHARRSRSSCVQCRRPQTCISSFSLSREHVIDVRDELVR